MKTLAEEAEAFIAPIAEVLNRCSSLTPQQTLTLLREGFYSGVLTAYTSDADFTLSLREHSEEVRRTVANRTFGRTQ